MGGRGQVTWDGRNMGSAQVGGAAAGEKQQEEKKPNKTHPNMVTLAVDLHMTSECPHPWRGQRFGL